MLSKKNIRLIELLEKWQNEERTSEEQAEMEKILNYIKYVYIPAKHEAEEAEE